MKDLKIRITGIAGQGVISAGDILSFAIVRKGYFLTTYRMFPSEIRGDGKCYYQLRLGEERIRTATKICDVLIALDEDTIFENISDLTKNGILIYDSEVVKKDLSEISQVQYGIPLTSIAKEIGSARSRNMVAIGVLVNLLDTIDLHTQIVSDIKRRYALKAPEVIKANIDAFEAGYQYAKTKIKREDKLHDLKIKSTGAKLIMSGNEAIGLAALAAGCRFFAGYPITPATEIMEWLAKEAPKVGGKMLQSEDEIAAINACIGASLGGVKAMSATSGPGLSLMQEGLGLASMAEIPLVIANVQRGGPSTGLPTKTEQSDLMAAMFGTHGESPKIVLAPIDVEDCFYQTIRAFNLAEEFQMHVIMLSDELLGPSSECVELIDIDTLTLKERQKPELKENEKYLRYKNTKSGVSPISCVGDENAMYAGTGLKHTEDCTPTADSETHKMMMEKRFRKLHSAVDAFTKPKRFGTKGSKIGIISWGSTCGAVLEAINEAQKQDIEIEALYPRTLYPFPTSWIKEFIQDKDVIIVIVGNYNAQFKSTIVERCADLNKNLKVVEFLKYDGMAFTAEEIYDEISRVSELKKRSDEIVTNKP